MKDLAIPDHLRQAVNERLDEVCLPGMLWLWFERQLAMGRCVVVSPKGINAVDAPDKQKYLDL